MSPWYQLDTVLRLSDDAPPMKHAERTDLKVYVVASLPPYETGSVDAVFSTRQAAEAHAFHLGYSMVAVLEFSLDEHCCDYTSPTS